MSGYTLAPGAPSALRIEAAYTRIRSSSHSLLSHTAASLLRHSPSLHWRQEFDMAVSDSLHGALLPRDGGLHPPPEVLLSWPTPNTVNPDNRGWGGSIVIIVVLAITTIVYVARIWARLAIGKNFGLDDTLITVAMIPLFGLVISSVLGRNDAALKSHHADTD
jgi:hypothetical protein